MERKAIVIGHTHHNTLGVIRSLGSMRVSILLILIDKYPETSYVSKSIYVKECIIVDDAKKAVKEYQERGLHSVPLIICSDDVAAEMNERVKSLMNKVVQGEYSLQVGLNTPTMVAGTAGREIKFDKYPCVVKPLMSIQGGKRIDVCNTPQELEKAVDSYPRGDKVLVQEYIAKDYEIVIDGVALEEEIIIPGYIRKERELLGGTTFSTVYPINKLPTDILQSVKEMISLTSYMGLFGIEMMIKDGQYWFVEINLRNDATSFSLTKAGANLPYIYYLNCIGASYEKEKKKPVRELKSIVEINDFSFVLNGKISPWKWLRELNQCECRYFKEGNDLTPYKIAKNNKIKFLFKKFFSSTH